MNAIAHGIRARIFASAADDAKVYVHGLNRVFALFFIAALAGCSDSEKVAVTEERESVTEPGNPASKVKLDPEAEIIRGLYEEIDIGAGRDEVDDLFKGHKIIVTAPAEYGLGKITVEYGDSPKLYHHQSPIGFGRVNVVYSLDERVIEKKFLEDYQGVKWREGYTDTEFGTKVPSLIDKP